MTDQNPVKSEDDRNGLDFLDGQASVTVGRGYSLFVKGLRRSFVYLSFIMMAVVAYWLVFNDPTQVQNTAPESHSTTQQQASGEAALLNAQFDGLDQEARPFRVTADEAVRSSQNADEVDMINPLADIFSAEDSWLAAMSQNGVFNEAANILKLKDQVRLFYDHGLEFLMPNVTIDLASNTAETDMPISGQMERGQIKASGLRIENAGQNIIFKGPATLTLYETGASADTIGDDE